MEESESGKIFQRSSLMLVSSGRWHSLNNNLFERFISLGLLRLVIIIAATFSSALNRSVLTDAWVEELSKRSLRSAFPNRSFYFLIIILPEIHFFNSFVPS